MVVPRKTDDACGTEMLCRLDDETECIGEASFCSSLLSLTAVVVINGEDAVRYPAWDSRGRSGGGLGSLLVKFWPRSWLEKYLLVWFGVISQKINAARRVI